MAELKFDSGFRVIGEYLNQIDSILGVKLSIWLSISSRILVPPVTQFLGQNDSMPFLNIDVYAQHVYLIYGGKCGKGTLWLIILNIHSVAYI